MESVPGGRGGAGGVAGWRKWRIKMTSVRLFVVHVGLHDKRVRSASEQPGGGAIYPGILPPWIHKCAFT